MSRGRKYRKPPVVEALCEIFFVGSAWDETVLGRFYDLIQEDFPTKRQLQVFEAQVAFEGNEATAGVRQKQPRMQFVNATGNRLVQLAPDLLVVNQLAPYPSFEDWEPLIYSMLEKYRQLASPKGVARLGVRYINRVLIPGETIRMQDYFTVYPQLPILAGNTHGPFMVSVELPFEKMDHTVRITFGTAPAQKQGEIAQLLDLYDICPMSGRTLAFDEIGSQVKAAHQNIESAFEGSITDRLRQLFEPETKG